MITMWKQDGKGLVRTGILERNCWIQVTAPTPLEIETIQREYHIEPDVITDILDMDERSRSERGDDYLLLIVRVPIHDASAEVPYQTMPLGIILVSDLIITISVREADVLRDFTQNRIRNIDVRNRPSFIMNMFLRLAVHFLGHLKDINRQSGSVEFELQKSIRNNELIRLLSLEKSLVFFTTSLKSNELLIEKVQKTGLVRLSEDEMDLLEDVMTENKQAIEMANIYSNILSGMMDAFASVISNNLNVVMKRLTTISIVLMIPTLIASVYGMNVGLPFQHSPFAFLGVMILSVAASAFGTWFFVRKKFF
ncbi:MAG TPA: magnesium transporter CorA family protein [Spirochaetia bacterium]|nr:magnesium transporter CorA family protein [Spirochaetia bacterium]